MRTCFLLVRVITIKGPSTPRASDFAKASPDTTSDSFPSSPNGFIGLASPKTGAGRRSWTADTKIFSLLLYHLSYPGTLFLSTENVCFSCSVAYSWRQLMSTGKVCKTETCLGDVLWNPFDWNLFGAKACCQKAGNFFCVLSCHIDIAFQIKNSIFWYGARISTVRKGLCK